MYIHIPALATSFDTCMLSNDAQTQTVQCTALHLHFHALNVLIMWLPSLSLHIHHAVPFSARGGSPFQLIKSDPYPSIVQRGKKRRGETERLISVSKQTVLVIILIISSQNNEAIEVLWQEMNVLHCRLKTPQKKNKYTKLPSALDFWSTWDKGNNHCRKANQANQMQCLLNLLHLFNLTILEKGAKENVWKREVHLKKKMWKVIG